MCNQISFLLFQQLAHNNLAVVIFSVSDLNMDGVSRSMFHSNSLVYIISIFFSLSHFFFKDLLALIGALWIAVHADIGITISKQ